MDIIMDNQVLTKVNSIKYLGIIVDHTLHWLDHITYVKAKISKGIGIMYMYKARKYLNNNTLKIYIPCLHLSTFNVLCQSMGLFF